MKTQDIWESPAAPSREASERPKKHLSHPTYFVLDGRGHQPINGILRA